MGRQVSELVSWKKQEEEDEEQEEEDRQEALAAYPAPSVRVLHSWPPILR